MLEKTYTFLKQIQQNNNREWYHSNKNLYMDAREEFEQITELLLHETLRFDKDLTGLTPKDCIFRIFRDTRFSKDKSPYKTNFGVFLCPGGKKSSHAGYYLHIEPGGSFIAAGIYMPPSDALRAIRMDIVRHYNEFLDIIQHPDIKENFGEMSGERLLNPPRGFDKDFKGIDLLKYKHYTFIANRSDMQMMDNDSFADIIRLFKAASSFVKFVNQAVDSKAYE